MILLSEKREDVPITKPQATFRAHVRVTITLLTMVYKIRHSKKCAVCHFRKKTKHLCSAKLSIMDNSSVFPCHGPQATVA